MDFSERIGRFCERLAPGFWEEPLNAVSNAAFLLAALAGFWIWRRQGGRDQPSLLLILAAFAVGIGSFLFHTFATPWSWLADVLPIAVFIAGYVLLAFHRFLGFGLAASLLSLAAFEALTVMTLRLAPPTFLNRTAGYFPALAALIVIGGALLLRSWNAKAPRARAAGRALLTAAFLFAVSLFFRIVDLAVCKAVPTGTHFLWHVFNAVVIFVLLRAAILHGPVKARKRG